MREKIDKVGLKSFGGDAIGLIRERKVPKVGNFEYMASHKVKTTVIEHHDQHSSFLMLFVVGNYT